MEEKELIEKNVSVCYSRGYGKGGKRYYYIRPKDDCYNQSRKVSGWTGDELFDAIVRCVKKWYEPIQYFMIEGKIIGSNNEENALKEWWRVCEKSQIGIRCAVEKIENKN